MERNYVATNGGRRRHNSYIVVTRDNKRSTWLLLPEQLEPAAVGSLLPRGRHLDTCDDVPGGMKLEPISSRNTYRADCTGQRPHEFTTRGQVGQESNLQPAVLETQSDVS